MFDSYHEYHPHEVTQDYLTLSRKIEYRALYYGILNNGNSYNVRWSRFVTNQIQTQDYSPKVTAREAAYYCVDWISRNQQSLCLGGSEV